jgi:hypothetical protein
LALLTAGILSACSPTVTTNKFKSFAELGRGFETAVDKVIDQAAVSNVDANSQELLNGRKGNRDARIADLSANNDAVIETNRSYAALKKQTALLSDYFTALGALASFDGESAIGTSATGFVNSLQALSPKLETIEVGNASAGDLVGAAAPLIVSGIKSARLRAELQRNGAIISRQLDLQNLLLEQLAEDIAADQDVLGEKVMLDDVLTPYVDGPSPPGGAWIAKRREVLAARALAPAPAAEAAKLSKKLKLAFIALSEGRLDPSDLSDYAADLGRLLTLVEMTRTPAKSGG